MIQNTNLEELDKETEQKQIENEETTADDAIPTAPPPTKGEPD